MACQIEAANIITISLLFFPPLSPHEKQVSLLVYDAILIEIWREEILPHLLKTESSLSPLMIYSVVSCHRITITKRASSLT